MTLVLPSLFSELEKPALANIVDELEKVPYLDQIVIGLDRASEEDFHYAREYFSRLPQHHRILWNDGPRLRELDAELTELGLAPTEPGKGRNVWYCFGYVLASGRAQAVAVHDCDIVTYERSMLARLLYPVANPAFSYEFSKGYFPRVGSGKLHGRVARLFVTPLLRSLRTVFGPSDYLDFLDSFRYPLAGEMAVRGDVLSDLRIPSDWGLEVGVLSEMYRNYALNRLCQVEIADIYDHKHQDLGADDKNAGLQKMSREIAKTIFRKMATHGVVFTPETARTIKATYHRKALDLVEAFYHDALMNGLSFDRHQEEQTVELFGSTILDAVDRLLEAPLETPFIPSWSRIRSASPEFFQRITAAVEADNA
jgi:glucosyl-3-phosphoglycerate synthase